MEAEIETEIETETESDAIPLRFIDCKYYSACLNKAAKENSYLVCFKCKRYKKEINYLELECNEIRRSLF